MSDSSAVDSVTSTQKKAGLNFILVCVLLDVLGIGLIIPVLPILVGDFAVGRDQQTLWFGLLLTLFSVMQFLCMPLVGAVSDTVGRRPVLLYSMIGLGINFLITGLATNVWMMVIGRVVGGMSAASMSVSSAYAADISTPENRAKSFGKIGAMFGVGFIVGPMLGGILGSIDLHLPFFVAAGLSLLNALYGYFVLPESLPKEKRHAFSLAKANPFSSLLNLAKRKDIRGLLVVFALVNFAQGLLYSTFVLYTNFRFGWGPRDAGIAMFCVGVSSVIAQTLLLGYLMKKIGDVRLTLLGLASGATVFFLYGLATQGWMMYLFMLGNVITFTAGPAMQGIISNSTSPREQGTLMGSMQGLASLMMLIAPTIATSILASVSHYPANDWRIGTTFFFGSIVQIAAVFIAWRYFVSHGKMRSAVKS